jgi:hypothetical protein
MPIDTPTTPATAESIENSTTEIATRRGLRHRRTGRKRLMIAGAIAAAGLVAGTGFTVQSAVATQARIDATTALTESTGLDHDQLGVYSTIAEARAIDTAADTLTVANATLAAVDGKVDSSGLAASVASLGDFQTLPIDSLVDLTAAQFQCLDQLWQKESGWSYTAYNASSGATGIPQSLPGSKMATAGSDWETNATTQVTWGLDYIARGYGTPCSAWSHSQSVNWY